MHKSFFANIKRGTTLFHRYEMRECLASHAIGGVYLCQDIKNRNRLVVLKVLYRHADTKEKDVEALRQELVISSYIQHPNVVKSFELYEDDDFAAFSMEYVSGINLDDLLRVQGPLDTWMALEILEQTANGLEEIHRLGVIHRDLKPSNIIISTDGIAKIADFGIAVPRASRFMVIHEGIEGTMDYVSPEYIQYGKFDFSSDIYALGMIAYRMITGHVPFDSQPTFRSMLLRVTEDPPAPSVIQENCDLELSEVIMKAISRDLRVRFQSVGEFVRTIHSIRERLRNDAPRYIHQFVEQARSHTNDSLGES